MFHHEKLLQWNVFIWVRWACIWFFNKPVTCESPLGSSRGFIPIQRFQNINFPSGTINVKLRLVRLIWIYTLTSQKVDYVVLAVFITISSCDLMIYIKIQILGWTIFFWANFLFNIKNLTYAAIFIVIKFKRCRFLVP